MERAILNWVPENWEKGVMSTHSWCQQIELDRYSEEFKQLQFEIRIALKDNNKHIEHIQRNQSVYDIGQFLIRGQLLLTLNPGTIYYQVRRYIKIRSNFLTMALNYNVDHRRCGLHSVVFLSEIPNLTSDDILLVIQVITTTPHSTYITPSNSSDYYIEYIVRF
ncbi:uncharacterized protein [Leptinotarsa decemlineata]|uniref:uncharacterized protein n=1 Tax=Leptinotarsa decemlineata TaxID=7539 RepID=UPI003D305CB6